MTTLALALLTALPMLSLPRMPTQTMPVSCADKLAELVAKMNAPGSIGRVSAHSTIIAGNTAYAESCGVASGVCATSGGADPSGADVVGTSRVGVPVSTDRRPLGFRITTVDGIAKLKWSFEGKSYVGTVTSCKNGYWTASSPTSAIAIKLAKPQQAAH